MDLLTSLLIICPLAAIAGFVDAVAGGGGLISLPAYFIAGLPPHLALGTNKLMSSLGTCVSTWRYIRLGYVRWLPALFCVPCAFMGSGIGSTLAQHVSALSLKILLLVLLPCTAFYLTRKRALREVKGEVSTRRVIVVGMAAAFIIGVYDGFYGPGTGVFLILALTMFARLKLTEANGLTKIINLTTNIAAVCVFLWHGNVILEIGLCAAAFNVAGNYVGASYFKNRGIKGTRAVMLVVIAIFMVRVIWDLAREFI